MNEISKQITQIEEYVRFGETLPTELSAVKIYLGYDNSNVPALSPANMQSLFVKIRAHVALWKKISAQAKNQLRELSITATQVVKDGKGLMRGLDALGPVAQILNTVGEVSIDLNEIKNKNIALDAHVMTRLKHLKPYIDVLHDTSLASLGDTNNTNKLIADFRAQSSILEAVVSGKVDKLKEGNPGTIGKEKTVEPMIDAYKEACARIVAQFGEGSEGAIAVKQQIEKTLAELTSRQASLQEQQRLTYAVGRLFVHLQGLGYAMVDAESALTHLWLTSSNTCTKLKNTTSSTSNINTEEILLNFYITLKTVLNDWASIKNDSTALYKNL